jgi:DNA polymerase III sliding clamp (beta) subunit (PCNA family)
MKIICDSSVFAKSCMNVQRTVSTKSTIPSLEGILISANDINKILMALEMVK